MTMATQARTETPARRSRPRYRVPLQLSVTGAEYKQLKRCARKRGLPFATWVKHMLMEEMRKPD